MRFGARFLYSIGLARPHSRLGTNPKPLPSKIDLKRLRSSRSALTSSHLKKSLTDDCTNHPPLLVGMLDHPSPVPKGKVRGIHLDLPRHLRAADTRLDSRMRWRMSHDDFSRVRMICGYFGSGSDGISLQETRSR